MQSGQIRVGFPSRRLVDHLRPRHREREPAGFCRHQRPARRSDWRADELERRVHARGVSGHAVPRLRRSDRRSQAGRRHDARDAARAPRPAGEAQRARHGEVSGQQRSGRAHLVVRARVSDAGVRAGSDRHQQRIRGDEEAVRARREDHRAVRPPVPAGAPSRRARRAIRAAVPGRHGQPEHRHVGRAREREGEPHASTPRNRTCRLPAC